MDSNLVLPLSPAPCSFFFENKLLAHFSGKSTDQFLNLILIACGLFTKKNL
jgi:hypothetical protein